MLNRIRAIRQQRGLTLAELAAACDPPTTPQTVGRLETGTRTLSTGWIARLAAGLGVDPDRLLELGERTTPEIVARLTAGGADALPSPQQAVLPHELAGDADFLCLTVETSQGEYRNGDQLWLRRIATDDAATQINRDCLVPRPGGRFAFGRLIDRRGSLVGLLPPGAGQKQLVIDNPPWLAVATMLVRAL